MNLLRRSLPGTIASTKGAPPVPVNVSNKDSNMAGSGFLNFTKTVLIPVFIAAALYLVVFHALLPLYRRHRARYSQYLPLQSTSLSSHLPEALQPSSLRDRLSAVFLRLFLPSTWAFRNRFNRRDSMVSADGELFDVESGEAMVGFDVQDRNRRRDGMERQVSNMVAATRTANQVQTAAMDSDRRLSRDLEEGFRDDSEDESRAHHVLSGGRSTPAQR
ncbi:hypothetical protein H2202_002240 [Exophiala xenobiotica]|nr:hypothetical protein H2202_002240 [Exophiala xenobiotica]KAK5230033.1 hypothetical protein LTR72_001568 [Exophiala xenobiotica]KAK5234872.1 hypothetical protein LTR47_004318 [Exophiala xenobiotica]KAK5253611.1 hypothetical protein LTS06_002043 [Exophiala xenobiotica]KAK5295999.1 hypothetical protein LTR14_003630 [Exophiala xenobiotica]